MNIFKSLLLALALTGIARGQGILLTAGDTWTYHFTNLEYVSSLDTGVGPPNWGAGFSFSYSHTNAINFRYELFEDVPPNGLFADGPPPIYSTTGTNTIGMLLPASVWQDLDGYVRFTVDQGSLLIDALTFTALRYTPGSPGRIDTFQTTVSLVPEPTSLALLTLGSAMLWHERRLSSRRKGTSFQIRHG